jgi:hypothetical protein
MLTSPASGSITNDHKSSSLCGTTLRLIAHLARVATYPLGGRSRNSRERANDTGLAVVDGVFWYT